MKKFLFTIFFLFLFSNTWFAKDCENIQDAFWKYKCRSENICKQYDDNKKVFNPEMFKEADNYKEASVSDVLLVTSINQKPIKKAVSIYKENMNSIYKCALIQIQKNSLRNLRPLLKLDKTWEVWKAISVKMDELNNRLDMISKSSKCLWIDKETTSNKLSILKQTTYITCDFAFYSEYLKEYYKNIWNGMWEEQEEFSSIEVSKKILNLSNSIDKELQHAIKIFPLAYHAYSEYENNFTVHFLLEIIKEDYNILRNKLHQVINPINQVGYKIMNAMWL